MAWIELHQTLPTNRKTMKLKRLLRIKTPQAVGHLCMLWLWAIDNAPDGDLSSFDADDIAEVVGWQGKDSELLIDALKQSGFLDDDMRIHDWDTYTGRLMDQRNTQREQARARKQRQRDRERERRDGHADVTRDRRDENVTVTLLPNTTVQNTTVPNKIILSVVDDAPARDAPEREQIEYAVDAYISNNLSMDRYFGMSAQIKETVSMLTDKVFDKFAQRSKVTDTDRFKVFLSTYRQSESKDGKWSISFPEERISLLCYAFEQAIAAGCPGNWKYIDGVLSRLGQRGISTLEQARDFDESRYAEG